MLSVILICPIFGSQGFIVNLTSHLNAALSCYTRMHTHMQTHMHTHPSWGSEKEKDIKHPRAGVTGDYKPFDVGFGNLA